MKRLFIASIAMIFLGVSLLIGFYIDKKEVTVSYQVLEQVVYTQKVKKDKAIGALFTYESDNHQTYASIWKNADGVIYDSTSVITGDVTLYGEVNPTLKLFTTDENDYTYINGINHVCRDGKVIVLPNYRDKEVCLGVSAINGNNEIRELYLPSTLHHVFDNNFVNCNNLTTIYFAGSEEEWDSIPNSSAIPEDILLVFNTSF